MMAKCNRNRVKGESPRNLTMPDNRYWTVGHRGRLPPGCAFLSERLARREAPPVWRELQFAGNAWEEGKKLKGQEDHWMATPFIARP